MMKLNRLHATASGMILMLICLLATSCLSPEKKFHSYRSIPSYGWVWGDTILFITPLTDSLATYHYSVEIRHNNSYPYRQIALAFSIKPLGKPTIYTDTLNCQLSNEQGVWQGEGWGNLFVNSHPGRSFTIPCSGSYILRLNHLMKRDTLPGLFNVGVKVEVKSESTP